MNSIRDQQGSAAFPTLVAVLLLMVGLGTMVYMARIPMVLSEVQAAAAYGARAGTQQATRPQARETAEQIARAHLEERGVPCVGPQYTVTPEGNGTLESGQTVRVTITCTVYTDDIAWVSLPTGQQISASFGAPVDRFRGNEP